jgi:hypothetical protein
MLSSGMLRRVALVRTDVSEERSAFFIRVTRIGELGTTPAATSNRSTLRRDTSETSVLTRATRRNIPEDTILHLPGTSILNICLNVHIYIFLVSDFMKKRKRACSGTKSAVILATATAAAEPKRARMSSS